MKVIRRVCTIGACLAGCGSHSPERQAQITPPDNGSDVPIVATVEPESHVPKSEGNERAIVRAQSILANEQGWVRVSFMEREKIAPCAAAAPVVRVQGEDSTHRTGEKYLTYTLEGEREYKSGETMPIGSAVIKRTFMPDGNTTGYFLMMKEEGENPEGGNWLYATTSEDGTLIRSGVLSDCASCHDKKRESDFLFRAGLFIL